MNLYLISQEENTGYDTYDFAVVCAADPDEARKIHPGHHIGGPPPAWTWCDWASSPDKVKAELIGVAYSNIPVGVVCASFNAG